VQPPAHQTTQRERHHAFHISALHETQDGWGEPYLTGGAKGGGWRVWKRTEVICRAKWPLKSLPPQVHIFDFSVQTQSQVIFDETEEQIEWLPFCNRIEILPKTAEARPAGERDGWVLCAMADKDDDKKGRRNVSTIGLLVLAFFWCSGGIYGNEALLEAAPPG
jgi:hypothetical protein